MIVGKEHKEFYKVDLENGFVDVPGYPPGFDHKILTGNLDEKNRTGARTRLLRLAPGTYSTTPFVHEYWEEVYLIQGDLYVGNDENGNGGKQFEGPTYACRPPGAFHGPFKSDGGCILLETHYFDGEEHEMSKGA